MSDKFTDYPQYDSDVTTDCEDCEKRIRAEVFKEVYNKIDEGLCDVCDYKDYGAKCYKDCHEHETLMKWLKGKIDECR